MNSPRWWAAEALRPQDQRPQILLAADSGLSDDAIATAIALFGLTVYRTSAASLKAIWKPP